MVVAGAVTYKFSVDEYHRMAEAGIFHEDDRIELVEGEIIRMAADREPAPWGSEQTERNLRSAGRREARNCKRAEHGPTQ